VEPYVRSFSNPDELIEIDTVRSEVISKAGLNVSRDTHRPGWRWSVHVRPLAGTAWCQVHHIGVVIDGRLGFLLQDGTEFEAGPGDLIDVPRDHDAWVIGDEPAVMVSWTGAKGWLGTLESLSDRILATVVFTDIVDSTGTALRLGDQAWGDTLATHEARTRDLLVRFRGREIKMTGDGVLAMFDGAGRALRCAAELRGASEDLGLRVRVAVHTGEVELAGTDLRGIAIHEAARMLGLAGPGEILVSAVTAGLASDAGLRLVDRGEHELRGITGSRRLYAIA
jgi:class 3 adenylate cyclase